MIKVMLKTAVVLLLSIGSLCFPYASSAEVLQSTHFQLNTNIGANLGGTGASSDFQLTDTGGQAANSAGASQSYLLGTGFIRQLPQSLELTVLPSGTYAYWPFDTGTGTVSYDMSSNSDNGTLVGSPSWTTGIISNAVTLDGSSQYMTTSNQVTGPNFFTLEFWFKSTSSNGGYLMGFGDAASGASTNLDRLVYMQSSGQLTFAVKPGGSYDTLTTTSSYNDGSWHHVAASLGSAGMAVYVDGVKQGSNTGVTTGGSYSGYWRMGYDNISGLPSAPSSNYVAASICEARVYTRQLSDSEVQDDYTAGFNGLDNAFTLPNITPGQSQTYSVDAVVQTDAPAYDLYTQMPSPLSRVGGGATFPSITGTIASPISWTEGTTKGFGFTVTAGYGLESSWGTSPSYNYAAVPSSLTEFHARPGTSPLDGAPEKTSIQYRADADSTQEQGTYTTTIIYTATMVP
jgi:Concanavalin A-like lectin/glucanases superfamily